MKFVRNFCELFKLFIDFWKLTYGYIDVTHANL